MHTNHSNPTPTSSRFRSGCRQLLMAAVVATATAGVLWAPSALSQQTNLHIFQSNTPASAQEVNDNFALLRDRISANTAAIADLYSRKLDVSGGTITGDLRVNGRLNAGFYVKTCGFPNNGAHGDCRCNGSDYVVSGGTWGAGPGNSLISLRESRPLDLRTWRVACINESGVRRNCETIVIVCARFGN